MMKMHMRSIVPRYECIYGFDRDPNSRDQSVGQKKKVEIKGEKKNEDK